MTRTLASAVSLLALLAAVPAHADWRQQQPVLRVGILSGENEADRLRRTACLKDKLEQRMGVPVEMYPASDYAGVMQGLLAGQLDIAGLGPVGYAGIYLQDPEAVEPVLVNAQVDGTLGYYAVIVVRADSGIETIEDLQGKSLAWADPNSSSGYLYPKAELELAGIDIDEHFSQTGFSGGHEQGVVAVLNNQYDAAATWSSLQGEYVEGYSRGNLRRMVDNGLLDMTDLRIIWTSNIIPNGPLVIRRALPQEAKDMLVGIYSRMHLDDPECFTAISGGDAGGFMATNHAFYEGAVELRRREIAQSR